MSSKKNKKNKKKKNINKNNINNDLKNKEMKTNKNNAGSDKSNTLIWRKIAIFSIIFLPYAIYLFLFKTNVSKYIKIPIVILLSILSFFIYDTVKYPNRVHNEVAFKNIQEVVVSRETNLQNVFHLEKKNSFEYKSVEYMAYHIYDEISMYYGIFEVEEYNKDYNLVYLYDMITNECIKIENDFDYFTGIHPIVFVEVIKNNILYNYNEITNVSTITKKDIFENNKYQTLTIDNKNIVFEFNEFGVISFKSEDGSIEYYNDIEPLKTSEFSSVYKVLSRNFENNYNIVGYTYYNLTPVFNVLVGDKKYIIRYYYGEGASLQSIDGEEVYFESLKNIGVE